MRVVMLSDLETAGGAATAASRLAGGLMAEGVDVIRIVHRPDRRTHEWTTISCPPIPLESAEGSSALADLERLLRNLAPEIINIHNIHWGAWGRWAPDLLEVCCRIAPTVWTLHDMWSFTGRCAYAYDCARFVSGCNEECPTPGEYPELLPHLIRPAWTARRDAFAQNGDLVGVAPSRWLVDEASRGFWGGHRIEHIPYDLPLEKFTLQDRLSARASLGVSGDGLVILTVAEDLSERRKGGGILQRVLQQKVLPPVTLVTVGEQPPSGLPETICHRPLGYVVDESVLVAAYNAADVLLHAAPVDNLPNVVLEALACGTPTVALPVGGIPDLVRPGRTGWLAASPTAESLAVTAAAALREIADGADLRGACRETAETEYRSGLQAKRYLALFDSILGRLAQPSA